MRLTAPIPRPDRTITPEIDLAADALPRVCRRRPGPQAICHVSPHQRWTAVQRFSQRTDDPPQPCFVGVDDSILFGDRYPAARAEALDGIERQQNGMFALEPDNFSGRGPPTAGMYPAASAHADAAIDAGSLDHQAAYGRNPPVPLVRRDGIQFRDNTFHALFPFPDHRPFIPIRITILPNHSQSAPNRYSASQEMLTCPQQLKFL